MKKRSTFFSLLAMLVLLASLVFQVTPAYAATQSIGGTAVAGNLRVDVYDNGAMAIGQYDGAVWQENIYGTSAKGSTLCVATTRYDMGGNSTWSPGAGGTAATWVSNTGGGAGTGAIVTTWTAGGMTIVQTTSYTDGNQYYTLTWDITNTSGGDISDLRLFNGQDTLLAGSDAGTGWWNAGLGTYGSIGVTHPTNGQQMWLQPVSEAPFNYESRAYFTSRANVNACALDGTVTAAVHDNGYALEFRHATLANGATWSVTTEEHFTPAAPATPAPTITSIVPNSGPAAGGTTVVITGTDLTGGTVTFGGVPAVCTVDSATQITCTTPAHASGLVDVAVTTPGGTATSVGGFTYIPAPTITSIVPNIGPEAGGTSVVITGTDLTGGTVTFGGVPAVCTVDSATQITCTSPAHAPGAVDVAVTTPGGTATSTGGFTYNAAPVAVDDSFAAKMSVAFNGASVLANDTDAEVDPLTAAVVTPPAHASAFTFNADGTFTYEPENGFRGTDTFTYMANDGLSNSNVATASIVVSPFVVTFQSIGWMDGWVLERTETSNTGGSLWANQILRVGDSARDQQYRSIVSFNVKTLSAQAVIVGAAVKLNRFDVAGVNPLMTHGRLIADMRRGFFGRSSALELVDFNAAANKLDVGRFSRVPGSLRWYQLVLAPANFQYINVGGLTQFRLRFGFDDNDNGIQDWIRFASGNSVTRGRPILVIEYYIPHP